MKKFLFILVAAAALTACNSGSESTKTEDTVITPLDTTPIITDTTNKMVDTSMKK